MPAISVIVPNFNHAAFLEKRFGSIFDQTFQDFEVIILDDCSTDNSLQIIEQYQDHPKVSQVIINTVNSGSTFRQWLKGIEASAGEWIWIAESDDWCEPTFLQTLVTGVSEHKNCVVAYCQSYCVYNGNNIKWHSSYPLLEDYQQGKVFIGKHMLYKNAIFNASMGIWKKDIFSKISKEFIRYTFCGDWLFWIELCTFGDVFISGKLLNYFRKHSRDVSGKAYETGLNFMEELQMLNYIYAGKVIDYTSYIAVLKGQFLGYKLIQHELPVQNRVLIENIFFSDPQIRSRLKSDYFRFKIKHTVKTWLTGKISKPD